MRSIKEFVHGIEFHCKFVIRSKWDIFSFTFVRMLNTTPNLRWKCVNNDAQSEIDSCDMHINNRLSTGSKNVMLNERMLDFGFDWIERSHDIAFDRRRFGCVYCMDGRRSKRMPRYTRTFFFSIKCIWNWFIFLRSDILRSPFITLNKH